MRFQGGTLFPMVVAIVVVLGLALVVYARQSRPAADASAPQLSDHWHHAYGFYLCDTWFQLSGDAEEPGTDDFAAYQRSGIHSHDDGLMHWHPFTSASVGANATLGVFLDTYGVELTNRQADVPREPACGAAVPAGDRRVRGRRDHLRHRRNRRGRRAQGRRVGQLHRHRRRHHVHRRLREHPSRQGSDGRCHRLRPGQHRCRHAAVGA